MRRELTEDELINITGGIPLRESLELDRLQYLYSIVNPETPLEFDEGWREDWLWQEHLKKKVK